MISIKRYEHRGTRVRICNNLCIVYVAGMTGVGLSLLLSPHLSCPKRTPHSAVVPWINLRLAPVPRIRNDRRYLPASAQDDLSPPIAVAEFVFYAIWVL